jgi:hypothetical protein
MDPVQKLESKFKTVERRKQLPATVEKPDPGFISGDLGVTA